MDKALRLFCIKSTVSDIKYCGGINKMRTRLSYSDVLTLEEAFEKFLIYKKSTNKSEETIRYYRQCIGHLRKIY